VTEANAKGFLAPMNLWLLSFVVLLGASSAVSGREYFVSPDGRDDQPGTRAQPWRTLDKANAVAAAGDTVTFQSGEYEGVLQPKNNGEQGAPITFRSEKPRGAVLRGVPGGPALSLVRKQHLVIDGFQVRPSEGRWATIQESQDIVVQNCRMEESRGGYTAFPITGCSNLRLLDNVFTRQLSLSNGLVLSGDMLVIDHCDRTLVQGNDFSKAGHGPAVWLLTTNDVVRRNVFHAEWGRLFALFNCQPILFEENILTENYHGSGSADAGSKILTMNGIVRRNLAVGNWDYVIHSFSYKYGDYPPWILTDSRFYHNTFADNASHAWWLGAPSSDPSCISGNIWKNNLFFHHTPWGGFRTFYIAGSLGEGNLWTHNLLCGKQPGAETILRFDPATKKSFSYSLAAAEEKFPQEFQGNFDFDPQFMDSAQGDYTLQPGSPCIDRGDFLTVAVEEGKGQEMRVADARWFYDGFGIEGEQGDLVMVGPEKQVARVVKVDRETQTLFLDRALSWHQGDGVALPYEGAAPDLGAMEYGAEGQPWFHRLTVPAGLRWRPPDDPTAPLVATDFEEEDVEEWGSVWYFNWQGNMDYDRATDTAATGKSCAHLRANKEGSTLEASIAPRGWDIDRYPWIRFSYRIPEGTPVGLRLEAFPAGVLSGERIVSIGGSAAYLATGNPNLARYQLIDDGQWHQVTIDARTIREVYPDVVGLYCFRFYTPANAREGQQFWFDDFALWPAEAK